MWPGPTSIFDGVEIEIRDHLGEPLGNAEPMLRLPRMPARQPSVIPPAPATQSSALGAPENQVRFGLSAGGRWIRTVSTAAP